MRLRPSPRKQDKRLKDKLEREKDPLCWDPGSLELPSLPFTVPKGLPYHPSPPLRPAKGCQIWEPMLNLGCLKAALLTPCSAFTKATVLAIAIS